MTIVVTWDQSYEVAYISSFGEYTKSSLAAFCVLSGLHHDALTHEHTKLSVAQAGRDAKSKGNVGAGR